MEASVLLQSTDSRSVGLVGGLGTAAGIFYYRELVRALSARQVAPRVLLAHADVAKVLPMAFAGEAHALADYLLAFLDRLAASGAEFGVVPAFSPLICAEELAARTPIPLIGLLESVIAEIGLRKLTRVALFGSRVTIQTRLFGSLEQIVEVVMPTPAEIDQISGLYGRAVQNEGVTPDEFTQLQSLAHELVRRERLDAIVIAGTDLAPVFRPENTDFPHLDGARVHVDAIVRRVT